MKNIKRAWAFLIITALMLVTVSNTVIAQVSLQNENNHIEVTYTRNSENIVMLPFFNFGISGTNAGIVDGIVVIKWSE